MRNLAAQGDIGVAWLAALPELLTRLERRWRITVGASLALGTEAFVAETVSASGELGVLKIPIPGSLSAVREAAFLRAADGHGYVRLLQHDPGSGAMLLERLGRQLFQFGYPIERTIEIICGILEEGWRAPPPGLPLMTGAEKAETLASDVRRVSKAIPGACSEAAVRVGLRFAEQRRDAFDPASAVLGHGDAHCWNTLEDPKTGGFKFVDPDGLFIERAHDLSISLREWPADLLAGDPVARGHARRDRMAALTGVDPVAIWQWGLLETLVNGLLYLEVGSPSDAAPFIAVAEAWAAAEAG
jgi:streptomycin 6-kinase